jgi:pyruvate dehydrogenase E1 component
MPMAAAASGDDNPATHGSEDSNPEETREWREALEAVVRHAGEDRGRYLIKQLELRARQLGIMTVAPSHSTYANSIPLENQIPHPGDVAMEERITAMVRWNALAMVVRANRVYGELGGHIASYTSAAEIFEIGFNHFFRGEDAVGGADLVFFQPHSSPGIYGRAFLEGRLTEEQLSNYRQEVGGNGLCSYPHPWLMPTF